MSDELALLKRALAREKKARKVAEKTLEEKSYELYLSNEALRKLNANLENQVKERTEALEESEARFRKIIESATDIIYRADYRGLFTYANPVAERKTGYSEAELKAMAFTELVVPEHRKAVLTFYRKQQEEGIEETYKEFLISTKNGEQLWLGQNVIMSFYPDGRVEEVSAVARDITRTKAMEAALRHNEEKYRGIIANMNLGLIEVNMEEQIQFVNQSFLDMSGYDEEDLLGKEATKILLKGANVELMKEKNQSRTQGVSDAYELAVKNKRGEAMWWLVSGAPLYNAEGQQTGSIGIHLDITRQKMLEAELIQARKTAEDSAHAKEVFLANMSHELRTPMNGVLGMARQLKKTQLSDDQSFYLETISGAAEHLLVILNDILDLSKIEAGKLSIEETPFSIPDVFKRARNILTPRAEEKGLRLHISLDPGIAPQVVGDPHRLNQVLLNLAGNAVKFTETGSITIQCTVLSSTAETQELAFEVADTGIGMDQDYLERIFDEFSQEDRSTTRQYGGTGLGMSITRELVHLMGGELAIHSIKGEGTEVTFRLILSTAQDTELPPQAPEEAESLSRFHGKHILLAEDNEINQLVVQAALNHPEIHLTVVENGAQALDHLHRHPVDVVLMDMNMPVMDGLEATRLLRQDVSETLPVIALTANVLAASRDECLKAGMNDVLTKPFEETDLLNMLARWLNQPQSTPTGTEERQQPLFSLDKIKQISRGNQGFVHKMINIFIEQTTEAVAIFEKAVTVQDPETIGKLAHRLKPSFDNLGVHQFTQEIREMERLGNAGEEWERLVELVEEYKEAVAVVNAGLRGELVSD